MPVIMSTPGPNVMSIGGERVLQRVIVLAVGDVDAEGARESHELTGAGSGDNDDIEGALAASHRRVVLEDECASLAMQASGDALDGYVAGGVLDGRAGGEHLAFACAFEVAVELLIDGHTAERRALGGGVVREW